MGHRKGYKIGLICVMIAMLSLAGVTLNSLNKSRAELGLTRVQPLENAPPVLAFTTKALGGFRGLIANALWIRASKLQESGKYFEMVQLSDWITKLQPHLAAVWVHQAWNMAYNISIKFNEPKDRWPWVHRGIRLLRDEGLQYNPREPLIYRELAWFYQHKIGEYLDDAHNFYKWYLAKEMSEALGPKGPPNWAELLDPKTDEQRARVQLLREKYKLDPAFMKQVDDYYGPLEWRLPESLAIYWATFGLTKTEAEKLKREDLITLRRVIYQSLQLAFRRGKLVRLGETEGDILYGPNIHVVKVANEAYIRQMEMQPDQAEHMSTGHRNFLGMAVYFLYTHNRKEAAGEWYKYLLERYPGAVQPPKNLDDYALSRISEDVGEIDHNRVKAIIMGVFEIAFMNYGVGEDDVAVNHELFAQRLWTRFMEAINSADQKQRQRVGLPPLKELREEVLARVLSDDYGLDPIINAQLRTRLNIPADAYRTPATTNAPPAAAAPEPQP